MLEFIGWEQGRPSFEDRSRNLKIRGRRQRRQRKRGLKSDFALFQSSLRLLQLANFSNVMEPIQVQKEKEEFHRRLFTSSTKREINTEKVCCS